MACNFVTKEEAGPRVRKLLDGMAIATKLVLCEVGILFNSVRARSLSDRGLVANPTHRERTR